MNNDRRKALAHVVTLLNSLMEARDAVKDALEGPKDEEREYYDNMPESIQQGDKGQTADAAADALGEVYDELEGLDIEDLISKVEEAAA